MGIWSAYVICEIPEVDADEGFPNQRRLPEETLKMVSLSEGRSYYFLD